MISLDDLRLFESFASTGMSPERVQKNIDSYLERSNSPSEEELANSYKKYMDWWNTKFHDTPERYIPKEKKAINFVDFTSRQMFKNIYELGKTKIEEYLFGDTDIEKLEAYVISFERKHRLI